MASSCSLPSFKQQLDSIKNIVGNENFSRIKDILESIHTNEKQKKREQKIQFHLMKGVLQKEMGARSVLVENEQIAIIVEHI